MDEVQVRRWITESLVGVELLEADDNLFFYIGDHRQLPFATLITNDLYDRDSDLSRPGVYRLNIGVGKATFQSLLQGEAAEGHDFTALNLLMPHPLYGQMFWVCILNPSEASWPNVQGLLAEAHELSRRRLAKRSPSSEKAEGTE